MIKRIIFSFIFFFSRYKTQLEAFQKQLAERTQQLFTSEKNLREEQFKIEALQARSKQIVDKNLEDSYESKLIKMESEHKAATDQVFFIIISFFILA